MFLPSRNIAKHCRHNDVPAFNQARERCAKVLDDEATRLDDKPIGVPTIVYSYAADRCRWLAARIRALPEVD